MLAFIIGLWGWDLVLQIQKVYVGQFAYKQSKNFFLSSNMSTQPVETCGYLWLVTSQSSLLQSKIWLNDFMLRITFQFRWWSSSIAAICMLNLHVPAQINGFVWKTNMRPMNIPWFIIIFPIKKMQYLRDKCPLFGQNHIYIYISYHIILYYIVLYYIILYYTILYYIILSHIISYYIILYCWWYWSPRYPSFIPIVSHFWLVKAKTLQIPVLAGVPTNDHKFYLA
jgi:hypothetical protein